MTEYKQLIEEVAKSLYKQNSLYDLEDLVQIGYIAVIRALNSFDETRGPKEPYIFSFIKNEINRFVSKLKLEIQNRKRIDLTKIKDFVDQEQNLINLEKLTEIEKTLIFLKCEGLTRKEICLATHLTKEEYYDIFFCAVGKILNG